MIDHVNEERGLSIVTCKFGIDGEGGFLKLCLSIQAPYQLNSEDVLPRRHTFKEGIASKKISDSGVNKLLIIGIVPGCKETYNKLKMLCSAININDVNGVYAVDLKVANILCGIGCHSSTYPCTWCFAHKDKLD